MKQEALRRFPEEGRRKKEGRGEIWRDAGEKEFHPFFSSKRGKEKGRGGEKSLRVIFLYLLRGRGGKNSTSGKHQYAKKRKGKKRRDGETDHLV